MRLYQTMDGVWVREIEGLRPGEWIDVTSFWEAPIAADLDGATEMSENDRHAAVQWLANRATKLPQSYGKLPPTCS